MHRPTIRFALAALATALLVLPLSACKKEGGASGEAGDAMSYIPKGSAVVVSVDLNKARSSDLFKKYQDQLLSNLPPELGLVKQHCEIDLVNDINTVVAGVGDNPDDDESIVFVMKGNFDKAKAGECMKNLGKEIGDSEEISIEEDGKLTVYKTPKKSLYVYWPDDKTLVLSPGGIENAEVMKKLISDSSVKDNKEVMEMVGKVDSGAAFWAAGKMPEAVAGQFGAMGGTPKALYLSLKLDSGLDGKMGILFDKEDDAKQMSMMATMGITAAKDQPPMGDLLENVSVDAEGKTLTVKAKLTGEQLDSLQKMAGGLGGGF